MINLENVTPCEIKQSIALMIHTLDDESMVIQNHNVLKRKNKIYIGEGHSMTEQDLETLVDILKNRENQSNALLPENVLGSSTSHAIWFNKGKVGSMWIKGKDGAQEFTVPWPNLIYYVHDGVLKIAAYKGCRPNGKTKLYHAPLLNIYRSTKVCLGNATVPPSSTIQDMNNWNSVIHDTLFTHINHNHTLKLSNRKKNEVSTASHIMFWRNLHKMKATTFPSDALVPLNINLEQFCSHRGAE